MGMDVGLPICLRIKKIAFTCLLFNCLIIGLCSGLWCTKYDETDCRENPNCNRTMECPDDEGKREHCYALWKNESGQTIPISQGCWIDHTPCYDKTGCVSAGPDSGGLYYCCCDGDYCNAEMFHIPEPPTSIVEPILYNTKGQLLNTIKISLLPITVVAVIICVVFWLYRRKKSVLYTESVPTHDPSPMPPPSPLIGLRPLQLLEIKARGRFGSVWKAQMLTELVAVKIFPVQDKESWVTEKDVYNLPQVGSNPNILTFIGAEKRCNGISTELWLITEFQESGSLYDYLKGNLVSWSDLLTMSQSMVAGMAFLHEEMPAVKSMELKPAVAHRDFKSKNVLIKQNKAACIADFGLALKFVPGRCVGDAHGQVGTRRYMAPEVLEGAINFSRDAFLRIDMYAVGLVLWELVSRCSAADGPVEEYRLPFEEEVGQHPTLEDMQDIVVQKKMRPQLKEHWRTNTYLMTLCDTIEECWDHDPEARLSAGCVEERLAQLVQLSITTSCLTSPLLTSNQQTPPKESSI